MIFLYKIRLGDKKNIDAFIKFMNEEYIPSIHKGATRVGKVEEARLLQNDESKI